MKVIILVSAFLVASVAQANIAPLLNEFIKNNLELKSKKSDVELSKLQYESLLVAKGLQMSLSGSYSDNKLDTSSTFNLSSAKNTLYSFGLSKSFFTGTTLSLSNGLLNIDRSAVSSALLGSSPTIINEFNQVLTLSQKLGKNFWGRVDELGLSQGEAAINLEKIAESEYKDQKIQEFYSKYLQVLQNSENTLFQRKAYKRAVDRTKLVRRKWKDGLAEKVDVLQAHNAQMTQKEQLQTYEMNTSSALASLESLMHRKISLSEVAIIDLEKQLIPSLPSGSLKSSLSYKKYKKQLEIAELKVEQSSYGLRPDIELSASYKTNNYDADRMETIKNGYIGKGDREIKVALTVTTGWGMAAEKNNIAIQKVNKRKSEYVLDAYSKSFEYQVSSLKQECKLLVNNIALAKERLVISKDVLKEYTRLYRVGKSDLDQLIRSEESLITTEKSLLSYYISLEQKIITLSALFGDVKAYLTSRSYVEGASIEKHN